MPDRHSRLQGNHITGPSAAQRRERRHIPAGKQTTIGDDAALAPSDTTTCGQRGEVENLY